MTEIIRLSCDSRQRKNLTDYNLSSYEIDLTNHAKITDIVSCRVIQAEVPNSEYLVNSSNNTINIFEEGVNPPTVSYSATIAVGDYTGTGLAAAVQTALQACGSPQAGGYDVTFDAVTHKLTVKNLNLVVAYFIIKPSSAFMVIGAKNENSPVVTGGVGTAGLQLPNQISLAPERYMYLYIDELKPIQSSSGRIMTSDSNIPAMPLARFQMNANVNEYVLLDTSNEQFYGERLKTFAQPLTLSNLTVRWFVNGRQPEFNGINHSFVLEFEKTKEPLGLQSRKRART